MPRGTDCRRRRSFGKGPDGGRDGGNLERALDAMPCLPRESGMHRRARDKSSRLTIAGLVIAYGINSAQTAMMKCTLPPDPLYSGRTAPLTPLCS